MTILGFCWGSPGTGGLAGIRLGQGWCAEPCRMLGDGGVIEKAQSSGSTQPPIGCIYSDKMPFHCLSPTVPGFSLGVAVGSIKVPPCPSQPPSSGVWLTSLDQRNCTVDCSGFLVFEFQLPLPLWGEKWSLTG